MQLNRRPLLPFIQRRARHLLDAWRLGKATKETVRASIDFASQISIHAQLPLRRSVLEQAKAILMENFLLDEYPFSPDFPCTREQTRQAIQTEGGTYWKVPRQGVCKANLQHIEGRSCAGSGIVSKMNGDSHHLCRLPLFHLKIGRTFTLFTMRKR